MPAARFWYFALAVLFAAGCTSPAKTSVYRIWQPTTAQVQKAEAVAREHARWTLHVEESRLARMTSDSFGSYDAGRQTIHLQFHDPEVFPNWNGTMLGGFPAYFRVDVDAESMRVVGDYASRE